MVKFNFMKMRKGRFTWKQIEKRNNRVFMRLKLRPVVFVGGA